MSMRRIRRILFAGAALYLGAFIGLLWMEDTLLYWPRTFASNWSAPADVSDLTDVWLTLDDGTELHGWWLQPGGWTPNQGALLHCHPKGANISFLVGHARAWRDRLSRGVLLFDYPGFGKSEGTVSEAGCCRASDAAWNWLLAEKKVDPSRIAIHGHSLGGAVAIDLAQHHPCEALLVSSTFTTFPEVAQDNVLVFPCRFCRNQFRSIDKIADVTSPVLIAHGTSDRRIPFSHGERLFAAAQAERRQFVRVDDGTHNLIAHPQVLDAMAAFLDANRQAPR